MFCFKIIRDISLLNSLARLNYTGHCTLFYGPVAADHINIPQIVSDPRQECHTQLGPGAVSASAHVLPSVSQNDHGQKCARPLQYRIDVAGAQKGQPCIACCAPSFTVAHSRLAN